MAVRPLVLSLLFALPIAVRHIGAQQIVVPGTHARGAVVADKDGLTLPAGDLTVAELIDSVALYLCRNYLFDPDTIEKAKGFTLQRPISLDALGSEEMLYSLLAARNLAAIPIDELRCVYQIVALFDDSVGHTKRSLPIAAIPWRSPEEILRRPRLRELVMTSVDVRHADAQQLANALRAHFSMQGNWQPGVPTACASEKNTLLLHGYRDQIAQTILMVQQIDRLSAPTPPRPDVFERLEALEREVAALRQQQAPLQAPKAR
ncbi:MAG: hypothetical protein ABIP94_21545 [Planctomycetota bacterium]